MKYFNIKRYKFSTIIKNINTAVVKNFNTLGSNFLKIFKFINLKQYDFKKITKYFYPRTYNIRRITKTKFISSKFLLYHLPISIVFFGFLYLIIPTFYNYDKTSITKAICKNKDIECLIRGEVNYSFYPTPRINIKDLIINDSLEKKTVLSVGHAAIKLSIKNLLAEEKHKFKKIQLNNFEINFNLKNLKKYRNIFDKEINFIPVTFKKGKAEFFDKKNYVATINDVELYLIIQKDSKEAELRGKFLNDNIYINFSEKKINNKPSTDIILKMSNLNLLTKVNFFKSTKNEESEVNGNILIKKNKNVITTIFDYNGKELNIIKSNLKNSFTDGKLKGKPIPNWLVELLSDSD